VLALGLCSKKLEESPIPATLVALLIGILLGPEVLNVINPANFGERSTILEHTARLALGIGLVSEDERGEEEKGQEAVNRFFSYPIFALLGTAIPWSGWMELGLSGTLLVVALLLLRRPTSLLLLSPLLPDLRSTADALFLGWFGPVAVAAIYYASMAEHRLKEPLVWDVVSLVICASVVLHGVSSTPLSRLYGKATGQRSKE
jgi:NhaP-type Na+/H+ or K+/H+ antiporter